MPVLNFRKPDSELSQTYAAIRMRNLRAKKRLDNEQKYLEENRVTSKHYNKNWAGIRESKPDYSGDPTYEELQERKQAETQQPDSGDESDKESNKEFDIGDSVSVKITLPDVDATLDDDLIVEALAEVDQELTKKQRKNRMKRERKKQERKKNKIPSSPSPPNEDVD